MSPHRLRRGLPAVPTRMASLPLNDNGYPVPWFVAWLDPQGNEIGGGMLAPSMDRGKPDFRVIGSGKRSRAIRDKLCWVCGEKLGVHVAFVIGPMCAVNRISAEPPSHRDCAQFSVRACPFLTRPDMHRRVGNLPAGVEDPPGVVIARNPGVVLIWHTTGYGLAPVDDGYLFRVGEPHAIEAFREGRRATWEELSESINSGLPILEAACEEDDDPEASRSALADQVARARSLLSVMIPPQTVT